MAISWGGYSTIGPVSVRAGVEHTVSPANPSPSTSSVTVTTRIYLGTATTGWGNGTWTAEGAPSGSGSFSWDLDKGQHVLVATVTTSVSLIYDQAQTFTGAGRVKPFTSYSGTVAKSASVTIPARPISAPNAPSSVAVARVDDSRQNVSWAATATAARPITGFRVTRSVNSGAWITVADLLGSARAWADRATGPGNIYRYQVFAQNSAGETVGSPVNVTVSTTPHRPAAPTAVKTATGGITVTRPALSASATSWAVAEFGGSTLVASVPASQATWTHADPDPAKAWRYVILARSSNPTLTSDWSAPSNTIQLISAPLAPTPLGPSVTDPAEGFYLEWRHNPVDSTPQRSYQIQTRPGTSGTWVNLTSQVNSEESQHYVPAGTWSAPATRQWRVQTWGQHADPSPYSPTAILALSTRPVAGIVQPGGATHDSPQLTVRWTYYDPEGSSQTGWRVELRSGDQLIESRSSSGAPTGVVLRSELTDGADYTVSVQVRDGAGLWSEPAVRHFTVTYAPPPTPSLEAVFRKDEGYVVLTPDVGPHGSRQPVSHLRVERSTADGWQLIHGELQPGEAATHMLPPLGTVVTYRAVAVSVIGSVAYSTPVQVQTKTKWLFLNHGAGFGQVVRIYGNLEAGRTFSRDKHLKRYAGRQYPVERAGTARERTYSLSGTLFAPWAPPDLTSTFEDFEALADAAAPVCVRDPEGVRMFVSTSGVDLSQHGRAHRRVSMTMTQVDYPEQDLAT